jgi:predicted phosphodiesterase
VKIALLADIHSNYVALEACMRIIDGSDYDGVVFLGDYIIDCPYPQKTISIVKQTMNKYPTWLIRGNREDYLISHHYNNDDDWHYCSNSGSLLYTYENITPEDIAFFENMPISMDVSINGCVPFTICHGSPSSTQESLLPNTVNSDLYLNSLEVKYLFCAHTHKPFKYELKEKRLINCASVGAPTNGQTKAQFVSIEFGDGVWNDKLVSVSYDVDKMVNAFEESGIYDKSFIWAKAMVKLLKTGVDYNFRCFERVADLARSNDKDTNIYNMPEKYWEQAARELSII